MADVGVVKSVGRVFEVLEHFRVERRPQTATEVARALAYPASSTLAILKSMAKLGYLNFERRTRTYIPSLRVTILGDWIENAFLGERSLVEIMRDLHDALGETITLSVQNDLEMQVIHIFLGSYPVVLNVARGQRLPLAKSAAGLAALSVLPKREARRLLERINVRERRPERRLDTLAIEARIAAIRRQGMASEFQDEALGLGVIAMPLPSQLPGRNVILGIAGPSERMRSNHSKIVSAMRRAVKAHLKRIQS